MTAPDQQLLREMLMELRDDLKENTDLKLTAIELKIDAIKKETANIKEQTTKTNGSVLKHTEDIRKLQSSLPHTVDSCPQAGIIKTLESEMITSVRIKRMFKTGIIILGTIVGIAAAVVAFIQNSLL